jgi:DNA polymerase-3 subunit gamma/tau
VYLIDEVHMLSTHSFNALLKTLEEPPPHVKFLLATTDPQKLPVTVLSRCLQFNLKRLPASLIAERLRAILEAEGVAFEPTAVAALARAADGSLRDALSLLDQMLAFGAGSVREDDARAMLGTLDRDHLTRLLDRLAAGDAAGLLAAVARMDEFAPDYLQVLDEFAGLLQKVALRQAVPGLEEDETWSPAVLDGFAARVPAEDLQLLYQIAILGRRDLPHAPDPRGGFEMVLLRMLAFRPAPASGAGPVAPVPAAGGATGARPGPAQGPPPAPPAAAGSGGAASGAAFDVSDWRGLLDRAGVQGAARQLASHCTVLSFSGDLLRLRLDARGEALRTRQQEQRLAQALSRAAGRDVRVDIEVAEDPGETPARQDAREHQARVEQAREALERDPTVQALKDRFGAVIQPDSVKPVG